MPSGPLAVSRRAILDLAWPVIATNLLTSAVQWVDLFMVATLGKEAVAAVGLSSQVQTLAWAVLMSVQTGTSVIVAQAWGARNPSRIERTMIQALYLGGGLSVVLTLVFCWPSSSLLYRIFLLLDAEVEVARIGAEYLGIVLLALLGMTVSLVGQAALRSVGDTRTPLWLTGGSNLLNIALNWLLIFGHLGLPALGVAGAGWGTMLSRCAEGVAYLLLLRSGRLAVRIRHAELRLHPALLRDLLRLGIPATLEMLVMNSGFLLYNRIIASFGTSALAAYQIGVILLQASFMPGFGFSVAATTLVGQWRGAADDRQARIAGSRCRNLALAFMPALGILFFFTARPFALLVLDDPEVVPRATEFIRVLALCQPAMAIHFALSGALRGAGDVRSPLYASTAAMYGARLPFAGITTYLLSLSLSWVWLAMLLAHLVQASVISIAWTGERWRGASRGTGTAP